MPKLYSSLKSVEHSYTGSQISTSNKVILELILGINWDHQYFPQRQPKTLEIIQYIYVYI